jgi:dihydrofolate reductase
MANVFLDISMSLDGFITGPNVSVERPMGDGGERLHQWLFGGKPDARLPAGHYPQVKADLDVLAEVYAATGAVLMGKRMFETGERPWGDEPPFHVPCFVLSHGGRDRLIKKGGTTFTFVSDGLESALRLAKAAAGDKGVNVMGGANVAQQCLRAGAVDDIQVHVVNVFLGAGTRLFEHLGTKPVELERTRVIDSPGVTHLRFRVVR